MAEQAKARESGVTQADRDAAANFMNSYPEYVWDGRTIHMARAGQLDDIHPVQAFAKHRTAALEVGRTEERARVVAWLRANTPGASVSPSHARKAADALERGEHVAEGEGRASG